MRRNKYVWVFDESKFEELFRINNFYFDNNWTRREIVAAWFKN